MHETLYDAIGSIFNPDINPFFNVRNNDDVEDAEIIEEYEKQK